MKEQSVFLDEDGNEVCQWCENEECNCGTFGNAIWQDPRDGSIWFDVERILAMEEIFEP